MTREETADRVLLALILILFAATILVASLTEGSGVDSYYEMSIRDIIVSAANSHMHTHICITGTVSSVKKEKDGDHHIMVCDGKCLLLETVPEFKVANPPVGHRIYACGIVRFDGWHQWWEVHPLLRWKEVKK